MLSKNSSEYRYFMELAYHGKHYHGWQIQPNAITVQEVLNKALSTILGEKVNIVGAGRTDTGVHASHFVAHFDIAGKIEDPPNLIYKLHRFGLKGIRIDAVKEVDNELHARFSAASRTYHYLISRKVNPFMEDLSWLHNREMDVALMNEACKALLAHKDFTSFARLHADTKTNDCDIMEAAWLEIDDYLVFRIKADRFLRNMVRAIVGTMVDLGMGKIGIKEFEDVIESKNRSNAGQSAPPEGLFLTHVEYKNFKTHPKSPFQNFIDKQK